MPRKSEARDILRQNEILDACAKLYADQGFHDITIKDISTETSISRPSIYNYFETKEEIFLGLLIRETRQWVEDLRAIRDQHDTLSRDDLIELIAKSLGKRTIMLKICAMNIYEIEEHSRLARLTAYKGIFKEAYDAFYDCLKKFMPDVSDERREAIRYAFFPFMNGIYPYVYPTKKQLAAMREVELSAPGMSVEEMIENFLKQILPA